MLKSILRKAFSVKGWKKIFTFKNDQGNFDWQEVGSTALQVGLLLVIAAISWWLGVPFEQLIDWIRTFGQ